MEKNSNQIQEMKKCFQYFTQKKDEELRSEKDFLKKMKRDKYDFIMSSILKLEPGESDFEAFCENQEEWGKSKKNKR